MVSLIVVLCLGQVDGDGSGKGWSRGRVDLLKMVLEIDVIFA